MNFSWRPANEDDADVVAALMLDLYREDPSPFEMTLEKARRTLATLAREPSRGVAVILGDGGAVAGYCVLASFWSNELGGTICVVDEIYVVAEHRGHGLASAFVRALIDGRTPWFGEAVAFELEVTPSNTRARALYERLGFAPKKNATLRLASARPGAA